jgi:hypothetical protein
MANFRFRMAQLLCATVGFALLTAAASPAHAEGRVNGAQVTELSVTPTLAWVHFNMNVGGPSRPSCIATGWSNEFMFDPTTDRGKVFLAHLEVAMSAGKMLDAFGAGDCFGEAEALGYVKVYAN